MTPDNATSLSSTPEGERRSRCRHVSSSLSTSPRSASVSAMFGRSPSLTVSNVLSFVVPRSANIFDAAAHVLILYGPKAPDLAISNDEFLSHMRQFLKSELLFTESSWEQLMTSKNCMAIFCDRIMSHLELIQSKRDTITDSADYELYVNYASLLKDLFDKKLQELEESASKDVSLKKDVIITNEMEESDRSGGSNPTKMIRRSQKAVSSLRPFGSPAMTSTADVIDALDDSEPDIDSCTVNNDGKSELSTSSTGPFAALKQLLSEGGIGSGNSERIYSPTRSASDVSHDDGIRLKKSADEAMFIAITLGIQRRLTNAFKLAPVADEILSMLPPKRWACPQEECSLVIQNANSPEGRECIQKHYQAHVDQYLSAMETLRLIGAGQHVENLLAKIDNMADLWSNEQSKLTIATSTNGIDI
ncbi:hypothetical protein V1525DRAFT_398248 [Lipomyces kononenkoae]|uniref:Uncharacterized protein n=1 Tax=Lipomyces kononenkoae TaxID=34357 RepID=A0ACC3T693_LIPKO